MENSLDPVHVEWLHGHFSNYALERLGRMEDPDWWRTPARPRRHEKIGFDVFDNGIVKRRVLEGDDENHPNWKYGHPICFPNMLRQDQIRVPMDDTHTLYWWYRVFPQREQDGVQEVKDIPTFKVPLPGTDAVGLPIWDVMDNNSGQDNYAWQSQGWVTPRWTEHLGESDKGIILYRRLLREQMKIVEEGGDPMNTFRDPATNVSIHVPSEGDATPEERAAAGIAGRGGGRMQDDDGGQRAPRQGAIATGQSDKYSPIAQQRAREAGVPVPPPTYREPVGFGQIHPRE
jgi:5,5'-dehydrodivanillate O-demethylase